MMKKHKRLILLNILLTGVLLAGCGHGNVVAVPETAAEVEEMQKEPVVEDQNPEMEALAKDGEAVTEDDEAVAEDDAPASLADLRTPVKAKAFTFLLMWRARRN